MKRMRLVAALALSLLAATTAAAPVAAALPTTRIANSFSFDLPLYVTHARDGRLFVVEQEGDIEIIHTNGSVTKFLDLSALVSQGGGERGLLGLAFHPLYASNGLFYVNYTRQGDHATVVAEYEVSGNANVADPGSARILLTIAQPAPNHNGGWMGFRGSNDLLFIATGDGGGSPDGRPQGKNSLHGKILRIRPLDPDGTGPLRYSNPPKNPYVGRRGLDEIFSRGLRNPWRCSFDRLNGNMWCADVGQNTWEEVNRVRNGRGINYGWAVLEGRACYNPPSGCNRSGKTMPVAVYSHDGYGGGNCSVTGGYVSRRSGAALYGKYVFGDFCSGRVWGIPAGFNGNLSNATHLLADTSFNITSFGEGADGRLYVVDRNGGVYRLNDS